MILYGQAIQGSHAPWHTLRNPHFWPHMRDDIEAYVKTFLIFQQDKVEQQVPQRLLELLPTLEHP